MALNTAKLREEIKRGLKINRGPLLRELNLSSEADLLKLSDEQLEARLNPKILGLLGLDMEDLRK